MRNRPDIIIATNHPREVAPHKILVNPRTLTFQKGRVIKPSRHPGWAEKGYGRIRFRLVLCLLCVDEQISHSDLHHAVWHDDVDGGPTHLEQYVWTVFRDYGDGRYKRTKDGDEENQRLCSWLGIRVFSQRKVFYVRWTEYDREPRPRPRTRPK